MRDFYSDEIELVKEVFSTYVQLGEESAKDGVKLDEILNNMKDSQDHMILISKCLETQVVHHLGTTSYYNVMSFEGYYKDVRYYNVRSKVKSESELLEIGKKYIIECKFTWLPVETAMMYVKQIKVKELKI